MTKSILIIVHNQDSSIGVGGRRWMKYSRELVVNNYNVHILCSRNEFNKSEASEKIDYHFYDTKYPKPLSKTPLSLLDKIRYKVSLLVQKINTKGILYDVGIRDKNQIKKIAKKLILEHNISNLICSGAPFSLLILGGELKKEMPSLNFIADIRDGWTWGHGYGIPDINESRLSYEKELEKNTFMLADKIFLASKDLKIQLNNYYPQFSNKIVVIENGADQIVFETQTSHNLPRNSKHIYHIGTVNRSTEKYWKPLFQNIKNKPEIVITFIGHTNNQLKNYATANNINNIIFKPRVNESDLHRELINADLFLMFKKDGFENSFPSKFFDYIQFKKPILTFCKSGSVHNEITKNKIGAVVNLDSIDNDLTETINELLTTNFFPTDYNYSKFTIQFLTLKIIQYLN